MNQDKSIKPSGSESILVDVSIPILPANYQTLITALNGTGAENSFLPECPSQGDKARELVWLSVHLLVSVFDSVGVERRFIALNALYSGTFPQILNEYPNLASASVAVGRREQGQDTVSAQQAFSCYLGWAALISFAKEMNIQLPQCEGLLSAVELLKDNSIMSGQDKIDFRIINDHITSFMDTVNLPLINHPTK